MLQSDYKLKETCRASGMPGGVTREAGGYPGSLDEIINKFDDPVQGWNSRAVKEIISEENYKWIREQANWNTFITLTFKEQKEPDVAWSLFRWFVRFNNVHAFGKNYSRKVGHSYFSYVVGLEFQKRDVAHFHLLVDRPLDFAYIHKVWGDRCGFAYIQTSFQDKEKVIKYICKYTVKGGEVEVFKAKRDYLPEVLQPWWIEKKVHLVKG